MEKNELGEKLEFSIQDLKALHDLHKKTIYRDLLSDKTIRGYVEIYRKKRKVSDKNQLTFFNY